MKLKKTTKVARLSERSLDATISERGITAQGLRVKSRLDGGRMVCDSKGRCYDDGY